jgi:hypothetical protein
MLREISMNPDASRSYEWIQLRDVIVDCMNTHLREVYEVTNFDDDSLKEIYDSINDLLKRFYDYPFTIQRVCELVYQPPSCYHRVTPYLRAIEKCLRIESSQTAIERLHGLLDEEEKVLEQPFLKTSFESDEELDQDPLLLSSHLRTLNDYIRYFSAPTDQDVSFEGSWEEDQDSTYLLEKLFDRVLY